jgi:hypothetical protein
VRMTSTARTSTTTASMNSASGWPSVNGIAAKASAATGAPARMQGLRFPGG